ncbi:hypothetical protein HK098_002882 [Nowakowskiella sp. JEL0407]|nr:hypothetical protein HK098_002882 [Nowakowskiella sp. JEL0407]
MSSTNNDADEIKIVHPINDPSEFSMNLIDSEPTKPATPRNSFFSSFIAISKAYLPLSVITFGGTQAHFAILIDVFVTRLQWVNEKEFAELFAISNSLPGPASTKVAYAIAVIRHGILMAIYSFLLWSVPGGIFMAVVALGVSNLGKSLPLWTQAIKNGLVAAALGLVVLAAHKLGKKLVTDRITHIINLISIICSITLYKEAWLFPCLMIFGGLTTYIWELIEPLINKVKTFKKRSRKNSKIIELDNVKEDDTEFDLSAEEIKYSQVNPTPDVKSLHSETKIIPESSPDPETAVSQSEIFKKFTLTAGFIVIFVWLVIFVSSILLRNFTPTTSPYNVFGTFFFIGSIIFGGGPVAVPLLQGYVTQSGWMTNSEFLIGYAIISALPGPMFNFAAYCGILALRNTPLTYLSAFFAWIGLFAPGVILQTGVLPIWFKYRTLNVAVTVFKGVNAAAAGLLFAAVYLLSKSAIDDQNIVNYPGFLAISCAVFVICGFLGLPAPIAVLLGGVLGIFRWIGVGMPV